MASRGRLVLLQQEVQMYRSLWENGPSAYHIYDLSKFFPNKFMIVVATFKSFVMLNPSAEYNLVMLQLIMLLISI